LAQAILAQAHEPGVSDFWLLFWFTEPTTL